MGLALRETGSGLVVAEEAIDEARIRAALKRMDPQLTLQKEGPRPDVPGGWAYKVLLLDNDYRPVWEAWWADDYGNLLPLTSGILDFVDRHRKDARNKPVTAEEHNARHLEQVRKLGRELAGDVIDDHKAKVARGQVQVSFADTRKLRYWQRGARPKSGMRP